MSILFNGWVGGSSILVNDIQVAEVLYQSGGYTIRNRRPNGTTGVCYTADSKDDISNWLNINYPGYIVEKHIG